MAELGLKSGFLPLGVVRGPSKFTSLEISISGRPNPEFPNL